jgi:hypothetical protein
MPDDEDKLLAAPRVVAAPSGRIARTLGTLSLRNVLQKVEPPPERIPLDLNHPLQLDVVMHEYDAIRSEVDHSLSNQVSILSFGAATVGLLVAAAGTLWSDAELLAGLLLLLVVPTACFLTLAIHAGELVRLMRAGLFLHDLENWVNKALWPGKPEVKPVRVLRWEQWAIREKGTDIDLYNSIGIRLVFGLLAYGFMFAGYWRLHSIGGFNELVAISVLVVSLLISVPCALWVKRLNGYAYKHRVKYERPEPRVAG